MTDDTPHTESEPTGATATATAEPPSKPPAPPATGTDEPRPEPGPKRRGCLIALAVAVIVLAVVFGYFFWQWRAAARQTRGPLTGLSSGPTAANNAFESALQKTNTTSPGQPSSPVPLTSVKPTGSHAFEATFTYPELTALVAAFSYQPPSGQGNVTVNSVSAGAQTSAVRLDGGVNVGGSTYSGWVSGPVSYSGNAIQMAGTFTANVGGIEITGAQADQAGAAVIQYFNSYLSAAPGLSVDSADVNSYGVHVTGTAPDSIAW